jgi:hypothetical protein
VALVGSDFFYLEVKVGRVRVKVIVDKPVSNSSVVKLAFRE